MAALRAALVWAVLFGMPRAAPSVPMEYCASANTAADMTPLFSIYQSDGRCSGNCTSLGYAMAIVQDKNCWCSNLVPNPADQKPLNRCQNPCPGYPSDYCGGNGLFGYMALAGNNPTGTAPPGPPPTSSSTPDGTSTTPSVQTVTVGGVVKTVTATPDPTSAGDGTLGQGSGTGLQAGAIAGIVVGVVGGLAVIAAIVWLWLWKRRRHQNEDDDKRLGSSSLGGGGGGGGGSPGTVATPKTSEVAAGGQPAAAGWDSSKRRSHLMPVDPRLDPYAKGIYVGNQNRSRESVNSLQDNQDYSRRVIDPPRVLRATNPDPEGDD